VRIAGAATFVAEWLRVQAQAHGYCIFVR